MLARLATRRHRAVAEPVGATVEEATRSTSKSAVSRRFVRRTAREPERLMARTWASSTPRRAVERWERLPPTRTAVQVGVLWAGLTVLFEFALGW